MDKINPALNDKNILTIFTDTIIHKVLTAKKY